MYNELIFLRIVSRGGHSTYRIRLPIGSDHNFFLEQWLALEKLGCTYEGSSASTKRLYALDIPPNANVAAVYLVLEKGEQEGIWEFEEAHYCEPSQVVRTTN